jgi:hypothetical protein
MDEPRTFAVATEACLHFLNLTADVTFEKPFESPTSRYGLWPLPDLRQSCPRDQKLLKGGIQFYRKPLKPSLRRPLVSPVLIHREQEAKGQGVLEPNSLKLRSQGVGAHRLTGCEGSLELGNEGALGRHERMFACSWIQERSPKRSLGQVTTGWWRA